MEKLIKLSAKIKVNLMYYGIINVPLNMKSIINVASNPSIIYYTM